MEAPWTAVRNTPNKSVRQNVPRRGVVLHHAAMTSLDGLRRLCMGFKQVSATAICKDNQIELLVPEGFRPWSLSSGFWDSALRSVETANESVNGWTISDASHWSLARAVAYWAHTDGFYPHRDGDPKTWTVLGHREIHSIHGASYATACPGGMDLGLVTRRAQQLLKGTSQASDTVEPLPAVAEEEEDMAKNVGVYYERGKNTFVYLVHNPVSGFAHEFSNGTGNGPMPSSYVNAVAKAYDTTSWAKVTEGHAKVIKDALAAVRGT